MTSESLPAVRRGATNQGWSISDVGGGSPLYAGEGGDAAMTELCSGVN